MSRAAEAGPAVVNGRPSRGRPVLYLDIDDTLVGYPDGRRGGPRPASGAPEFLAWALRRFEVRWLTRWCPTGRMRDDQVRAFSDMLRVEADVVRRIRGLDWTCSETKLDGIAWLEHVVLGRPFLWIEDEWGMGERERAFLRDHGFDEYWRHCNVTQNPGALASLHRTLLDRRG